MDGRGVITIAAHRHENVHAADGFYVAAAHNPGVHGAILTEALSSRFSVHIEVTTDFDLARHLGVPAAAVNAAIALNTELAAGDVDWAPQLRELLAFHRTATPWATPPRSPTSPRSPPTPTRPTSPPSSPTFGTTITSLTLGTRR